MLALWGLTVSGPPSEAFSGVHTFPWVDFASGEMLSALPSDLPSCHHPHRQGAEAN